MDKRSELHSRCLIKIILRHTYSFVYTNKTAITSNGSVSNIYINFVSKMTNPKYIFCFRKILKKNPASLDNLAK